MKGKKIMCKLKSVIVLKEQIFCPDYDSHTDMLAELGIEDTTANAERLFVRVELYPENGDPFTPLAEWVYKKDQDITPEWYVKDYEEKRVREAVENWAKNRIYIGVDGLKLSEGAGYYLKDCINITMYGSSQVNEMYGSSQVNRMYGSSQVNEMYGSSQVNRMYGSSQVNRMYGSSQVNEMYGSSQVNRMYGSSQVSIPVNWSQNVKTDIIILSDNAIIKDARCKKIFTSGDWELVTVDKKEQV